MAQAANQLTALARTFCKTYCELQEVRLDACYAASPPHAAAAAAGPTTPVDHAWWLATYNNALVASPIGAAIAAVDEEAIQHYGGIFDLMSLATCLVPELAVGGIQNSPVSGELFLQWARNATAVEELYTITMQSLNNAAIVLEASDVHEVLSAIMRLINTHCFGKASALLGVLLAHIRAHATIDAPCEKSISEIQNLLINDFANPVQFESWQRKAQEYLKDGRFQLQPQGYDAPTVVVLKADLLNLLIAFAGDAAGAGVVVGGNIPTLHMAGICAYIDPFMSYAAMGERAMTVFGGCGPSKKAPLGKKAFDASVAIVGNLLSCATLADVVSAMSGFINEVFSASSSSSAATTTDAVAYAKKFLSLLVAAHIADVASPPFAAPNAAAMRTLTVGNTIVERYVSLLHNVLRDEEDEVTNATNSASATSSSAYRICGLYLCWRPLSNPEVMKSIISLQLEEARAVLFSAADLESIRKSPLNNNGGSSGGAFVNKTNAGSGSGVLSDDDAISALLAKEEALASIANHQIDAYIASLDALTELIFSLFHADAPLQKKLRPIVLGMCGCLSSAAPTKGGGNTTSHAATAAASANVAVPLYSWWDKYLHGLLTNTIRPKITNILAKASRYTELLIRSVAANEFSELSRVLNKVISSRDALTHPAVLQCGEAINYGLVDLGHILANNNQQQHQHANSNTNITMGIASSGNGGVPLLIGASNINNTSAHDQSALVACDATGSSTSNASAAAVSEVIAMLHICSCIWDMTVGALTSGNAFADLLAAARISAVANSKKQQSQHGDDGDDDDGDDDNADAAANDTAAAAAAAATSTVALIDRPFVAAAASLTTGARRLAETPNGFERLSNSVRFTLLQRLTNVLETIRYGGGSLASAGAVFGTDGYGVARASQLFMLLIDIATGIDTSVFVLEGVLGGDEAEEELKAMTRSLVEMGRCWC